MRLPKANEIKSIILSIDPNARVYLFGSRVDDQKLGGDIDLLVISRVIDLKSKLLILNRMYDLIGEQKIDIVIAPNLLDPFHKHAFDTGVEL